MREAFLYVSTSEAGRFRVYFTDRTRSPAVTGSGCVIPGPTEGSDTFSGRIRVIFTGKPTSEQAEGTCRTIERTWNIRDWKWSAECSSVIRKAAEPDPDDKWWGIRRRIDEPYKLMQPEEQYKAWEVLNQRPVQHARQPVWEPCRLWEALNQNMKNS